MENLSSPNTDKIPDYIEPITAWRVFAVLPSSEGLPCLAALTSAIMRYAKGQYYRALCMRRLQDVHEPPQQDCTCGFYSSKTCATSADLMEYWNRNNISLAWSWVDGPYIASYALGKVEIWGEVVEHEEGYRSQFMRVKEVVAFVGTPEALVCLEKEWGTVPIVQFNAPPAGLKIQWHQIEDLDLSGLAEWLEEPQRIVSLVGVGAPVPEPLRFFFGEVVTPEEVVRRETVRLSTVAFHPIGDDTSLGWVYEGKRWTLEGYPEIYLEGNNGNRYANPAIRGRARLRARAEIESARRETPILLP
jgi:hypothetical protein